MAKVRSPLFSQRASGTLAEVLTFSHRKTGQQVRTQRKQKDQNTIGQIAQRVKYIEAVSAWNNLSTSEKSLWIVRAYGQNLTGYNLFVADFLNEYVPATSLAIYGVGVYGLMIYGEV